MGVTGEDQLRPTGVNLCGDGLAMISDRAGGAIVAFSDSRATEGETVYAQRIDAHGNPVWPVDGILFGQQPNANDLPTTRQGGGKWNVSVNSARYARIPGAMRFMAAS